MVLISCTCCLTQTWNLSKIPHQTSCHAMRTMIGNDGGLDTSTECWLALDKDKGECWVRWTLPDKLAAPRPLHQVNKCWSGGMRAKWFPSFHLWLPNTQHSCWAAGPGRRYATSGFCHVSKKFGHDWVHEERRDCERRHVRWMVQFTPAT